MKNVSLWIAQGFGLGRMPVAPGTFGTIGGLVWFGVLLWSGGPVLFGVGLLLGIAISISTSGTAEKVLRRRDPGSVVIDEITAVPLCFVVWLWMRYTGDQQWQGVQWVLGSRAMLEVLGVFVLFRVFDILKPWPVRQIQDLPGGWGVTMDDVLAAGYVNLCVWVGFFGGRLLTGSAGS
jgi:phosphatidylglycerophosphatase A